MNKIFRNCLGCFFLLLPLGILFTAVAISDWRGAVFMALVMGFVVGCAGLGIWLIIE